MKLVLYGGGDAEENYTLDENLSYLIERRNPKLTYIPSSSYQSELEFREIIKQYSPFGIKKFMLFPVDIHFDETFLNEILSSDVIYLGGGNTYFFLRTLRQQKLIPRLKKFVLDGGVLAGLSAGAILMTPNIETAGYPDFDRDDNDIDLKNLNGMRLVNFEFFPHYRNSPRYYEELIHQSALTLNPIYACPDGAGIIVNGDMVSFVGKVRLFYHGECINFLKPNFAAFGARGIKL